MAKPKYEKWITKEGLSQIEEWAADGKKDKYIYGKIGVTKSTFYQWLNDHPDISDAIKKGRAKYVKSKAPEVEDSSINSAVGYYVTEKVTESRYNKDGEFMGRVEKETKRYVKPDTAMQIFLLTNLMPDKYVNRREYNTKIEGGCIICDGESELKE